MAFDYTAYIARIRRLIKDTTTTVFSDADIQSYIDDKAITVYRSPLLAVNYRVWKTTAPYWLDDGTGTDVIVYDSIYHDANTITKDTIDNVKGIITFSSDHYSQLYVGGTAFNLYEVCADLLLQYLVEYKHDFDYSNAGSYQPTSRRQTYVDLQKKYMRDGSLWTLNDSYLVRDNWPFDTLGYVHPFTVKRVP